MHHFRLNERRISLIMITDDICLIDLMFNVLCMVAVGAIECLKCWNVMEVSCASGDLPPIRCDSKDRYCLVYTAYMADGSESNPITLLNIILYLSIAVA